MKKMILMTLIASLVMVSQAAMAQDEKVLSSFEGNISEKEWALSNMIGVFGVAGYKFAETVKFTAPRPNWNLKTVRILSWDGFNGTVESIPVRNLIALEVRDKDLNLLYKLTDNQIAYSNFAFNLSNPLIMEIELPSIPVSDDFYVSFYDRGSLGIGYETINETNNKSFILNPAAREIVPAQLPVNDTVTPVNWLMEVVGS